MRNYEPELSVRKYDVDAETCSSESAWTYEERHGENCLVEVTKCLVKYEGEKFSGFLTRSLVNCNS